MTKSMNNLETNKVELEQKIYACWLDTIYWLASGSKYKLLEAAGSAKSIYDMSEKELQEQSAENGFYSTKNCIIPKKYGMVSQNLG